MTRLREGDGEDEEGERDHNVIGSAGPARQGHGGPRVRDLSHGDGSEEPCGDQGARRECEEEPQCDRGIDQPVDCPLQALHSASKPSHPGRSNKYPPPPHGPDAGGWKESNRVSVRIVVRGRVQGVSFRAATLEKATIHGVEGWVRNRSDGSVEALLQGDEEEVRRVLDWARRGPPLASVTEVEEEVLDVYPPQKGFRISD